jgi:hypothetical protein
MFSGRFSVIYAGKTLFTLNANWATLHNSSPRNPIGDTEKITLSPLETHRYPPAEELTTSTAQGLLQKRKKYDRYKNYSI